LWKYKPNEVCNNILETVSINNGFLVIFYATIFLATVLTTNLVFKTK